MGVRYRYSNRPTALSTPTESFQFRSKEVEDIIILIDGRPELLEEVQQAKTALRQFIAEGIGGLLRLSEIDYTIQSSSSVRANPARGMLIHQRMKDLSTLA